jgi:RNA polymerase-binding transcription factor DksA
MKTRSATSNARRTLLRRGRDLLRSVSKRRARGRAKPPDVMDLLSEGQRAELGLIHLALERIERGIFGLCEDCSERISEERLLETPWKPACAACEAQRATPQAAPELGAPNLPL